MFLFHRVPRDSTVQAGRERVPQGSGKTSRAAKRRALRSPRGVQYVLREIRAVKRQPSN